MESGGDTQVSVMNRKPLETGKVLIGWKNTGKRVGPMMEMQWIGISHFSYLWFPCSLLEPEDIPVPHLADCPNAFICGPRTEDTYEHPSQKSLYWTCPLSY